MIEEFGRALRQAATRGIEGIANFLPGAIVFLVLLLASFLIALAVRYALLRALRGLDVERRAELLGFSVADWSPSRSAAQLFASVGYWVVLAVGLLLSLTALDAALPSRFAMSVLQYIPDLAAAALIVFVGGVLARFLARAVLIGAVNMHLQFARFLSLTVKWVVLIVAAAMALDHVGIGRTALLLAFGIVFGGVVLAASLAVGLGARDVVGRALERRLREPAPHDRLDHV